MTTLNPGLVNPPGQVYNDPNQGYEQAYMDAVEVKVAGRSNLFLADGPGAGPLNWFGEQLDDTPIISREFFNDVPGDSNGGPQGPPIERQMLGRIIQISFTLSAWSQEIRYWLETHNGAYATNGAVKDYEVGNIIMTLHSFRLLVVPARDNRTNANPAGKNEDFFTYNFPCTIISSPIECGQGTKFSTLRFTMEAHRAPPNWIKRGVVWDRDITGYSAAVAERDAAMRAHWDAIQAERAKHDRDAGT